MAKAYVLVGNSGCGKGTQAALLSKKLSQPLYIETGAKFRELITGASYTSQKTKEVIERGALPPSFLAIHIWAQLCIEEYHGQEVIIDGAPRSRDEVPLLLGAADFYGWDLHIVYITVRDEWAHNRMKGRGRADDQAEHMLWGRIQWFYEHVAPAIDMLHASPLVSFHTVNGEQSPDRVHEDICTTLGLV